MPHVNGYSVYVHMHRDDTHTVRLYRDSDDTHVHSWEGCIGLDVTMRSVAKEIRDDFGSGPDPSLKDAA